MPFTPFHFGPGIMVKAFERRRFWLSSFMAANVLIDCEVLYYLRQGSVPIHRYLHTYIGGFAAGLLAGAVMFGIAKLATRVRDRMINKRRVIVDPATLTNPDDAAPSRVTPVARPGTPLAASLVSGVIGGVSHVLLDSLMHRDMHPFWPFADGNGLIGVVDISTLHIALAASGFFGLMFWLLLWDRQ